jgi:hypothetical protein
LEIDCATAEHVRKSRRRETFIAVSEPTDIPVVQPVVVKDDERFLKWLARAKEAKPSVATDDAETEAGEVSQGDIANIPEAIIVKHKGSGGQQKSGLPSVGRPGLKPVGRDLPGSKLPDRRSAAEMEMRADESPSKLDTSRITSMEDYNEGRTKIEPLKRAVNQDGDRGLERPQMRGGKMSRAVERGVLHPQPITVVVAALVLLIAKLLTVAVLITLPIVTIVGGREAMPKTVPLLVAFLVFGIWYLISSNKARCRVCSCHLFYVRHCLKHKLSHKIPLAGRATSAALHLLLFKWMRCMYCGTAIRLRGSSGIGKPKKGELDEEGFVKE